MAYTLPTLTHWGKVMTKQEIINLLKTNDKAVIRAILVLNERQTEDEQMMGATTHSNGRGFSAAHAAIGTSMANFYEKNGYLSPKQIAYWRKETASGRMKIEIYAGQLLEIAKEKAARMMDKMETA